MKKYFANNIEINAQDLRNAAHETSFAGCRRDYRVQIRFDLSDGKVYATPQLGGDWIENRDPDTITVCYAARRMSQKAIAEAIQEAVSRRQ